MPAAMSTDKEAGGESFAALFEQGQREAPVRRHRAYRPGDSVRGVVVQVGKDAVFLELDGKRQAMIEAVETSTVGMPCRDTAAAWVTSYIGGNG